MSLQMRSLGSRGFPQTLLGSQSGLRARAEKGGRWPVCPQSPALAPQGGVSALLLLPSMQGPLVWSRGQPVTLGSPGRGLPGAGRCWPPARASTLAQPPRPPLPCPLQETWSPRGPNLEPSRPRGVAPCVPGQQNRTREVRPRALPTAERTQLGAVGSSASVSGEHSLVPLSAGPGPGRWSAPWPDPPRPQQALRP